MPVVPRSTEGTVRIEFGAKTLSPVSTTTGIWVLI